jgi:hypothetical protein
MVKGGIEVHDLQDWKTRTETGIGTQMGGHGTGITNTKIRY